jgi:hypothetical protein
MIQRGLGAALAGWAQLIARGEFWFGALLVMAVDGMEGYFQGQAIADMESGGSAQQLGVISAIFGLGGFLISAAIQFLLARKLGGDGTDEAPAAVGKWIALTLAYGLIATLAVMLVPFFLARSDASPQVYGYIYPAVQLAVGVALLPIAVRMVSAAHSGNRHRIGAVTRFLRNEAAVWFGGRALLGAAVFGFGYGLSLVTAMTGYSTFTMLIGGLVNGLAWALLSLWPIAAYRAMGGREQVAETFF